MLLNGVSLICHGIPCTTDKNWLPYVPNSALANNQCEPQVNADANLTNLQQFYTASNFIIPSDHNTCSHVCMHTHFHPGQTPKINHECILINRSHINKVITQDQIIASCLGNQHAELTFRLFQLSNCLHNKLMFSFD